MVRCNQPVDRGAKQVRPAEVGVRGRIAAGVNEELMYFLSKVCYKVMRCSYITLHATM